MNLYLDRRFLNFKTVPTLSVQDHFITCNIGVCVCVWERERERESISVYPSFQKVFIYSLPTMIRLYDSWLIQYMHIHTFFLRLWLKVMFAIKCDLVFLIFVR